MQHPLGDRSGLTPRTQAGDGRYRAGVDGVIGILSTADEKVDFICYGDRVEAHVRSKMGYPACYPLHAAGIERPVRAVLMDLDGTTVRSEGFWMWIIERTTAELLADDGFRLADDDGPFVSGHSVSEHLNHCIAKYCPTATVEQAREIYTRITRREMRAIEAGGGRADAFTPAPGVRDFLLALKDRGIRIACVTSGLREKAWPEILAAFGAMGLGDPREFYDAIVTAGVLVSPGQVGTLGELEAKPHPWLYAEAARVGLGIEFADRGRVVGIEDSGAGVVSLRLAGFAVLGMAGGNIDSGGARCLVERYCGDFEQALRIIDGQE